MMGVWVAFNCVTPYDPPRKMIIEESSIL